MLSAKALLMDKTEALQIVSYKLGLKLGETALEDSVLCHQTIKNAIADKAADTVKTIDTKAYMAAMKSVKLIRLEHAKQQSEVFLQENASQKGVCTTASGLQYRIITPGSGATPSASDSVTVHYHGTLTDGSVFDSSYDRGKPAQFSLNKLIEGWKEGLQLLPTGSKAQLFVPQELAYGERGSGSKVPPYATLIFDLELLEIHTV